MLETGGEEGREKGGKGGEGERDSGRAGGRERVPLIYGFQQQHFIRVLFGSILIHIPVRVTTGRCKAELHGSRS